MQTEKTLGDYCKMLGRTHITVGIASALIITHPETVPGVMAAITGGGLGGWIVDIDCKDADADREKVYDTIIDGLFIGAFIALDFFVGNGMCQYISDHWGVEIWGSLMGFIILALISFNTKHRTFTHSILGLFLFGLIMCFLCQPAAAPFVIGYASHMIIDLFNKRGEQLFFPLKKRFCFGLCDAGGAVNKILFWIAFGIDVIVGAFFFSQAMITAWDGSEFVNRLLSLEVLGINSLQLYLVFINLVTFLGFQRSWRLRDREESVDKDVRIMVEFETWLLDFLVFIGGGIGMLIALVIHLAYPSGYNGNWWAFCYSSILLWFTVYCYVCNPFGHKLMGVNWLSSTHIPILVYVLAINIITALIVRSFRKRHLNEYSGKHTLLLMLGALGGTLGGFIGAIVIHRDKSLNYAVIGFPIMLISQTIFVMYMMAARIL